MKDDKHGVAMGIPHVKCDNAKVFENSECSYTVEDIETSNGIKQN